MKSKLLLFILLLPALVLTSCKKFPDKPSNNSYTVPNTLNDLQGLLDDADEMNDRVTPSFGEASSDNYFRPRRPMLRSEMNYRKRTPGHRMIILRPMTGRTLTCLFIIPIIAWTSFRVFLLLPPTHPYGIM